MENNYLKSYNLIIQILRDYELGDAYLVLQGLELVGYDNINFWFKLVEYVKNYKGIETLVAYIDTMQEIGREHILSFMNYIKINELEFNESYNQFVNLLIATNKYSEEMFKIKK